MNTDEQIIAAQQLDPVEAGRIIRQLGNIAPDYQLASGPISDRLMGEIVRTFIIAAVEPWIASEANGTAILMAPEWKMSKGVALGGVDLTSAAGKMTMAVIAAVAEFERDLLVERTQAGLARAKAQGKRLGRPSSLNAEQLDAVRLRRSQGVSLNALAKEFGVSRSAIQRSTA